MNVTIDIKMLAIIILVVALVVLVVYLVKLLKKLMETLDHANTILEDIEVVAEIAADRSKEIDGIIDNVSTSVSDMSEAIKGKQGVLSTTSSVVKAVAAVINMCDKKADK